MERFVLDERGVVASSRWWLWWMERFVLDERGVLAGSCWMNVGVVDGRVRITWGGDRLGLGLGLGFGLGVILIIVILIIINF